MDQNQGYGFTPPPPNAMGHGPMAPAGTGAHMQGNTIYPGSAPNPLVQMGMKHFQDGFMHGFGAGAAHIMQQFMPQQHQMPTPGPMGQAPNMPTQGPY